KGLARWMFEARHEDGKRLGNSAGRGRGFGTQDRPLAPNLGTREAEDVCTCTCATFAFVLLVATDRRMAPAGHACKQWDDSRARRACVLTWAPACAQTWVLACARTPKTRRETRSWQAQAGARTRQTRRETRSWQVQAGARTRQVRREKWNRPRIFRDVAGRALNAGTWSLSFVTTGWKAAYK
ncbi:hypothetical protein HAX54_033485, partial [Datura stramonium]|nr:hypothetical protein [Datura stramonium]